MELFVMNRFQGEETKSGLSEKEAKILARLNSRKNQKTTQGTSFSELNVSAEKLPSSPDREDETTKRKKGKKVELVASVSTSENDQELVRSKKKKKKKDNEVSLNDIPQTLKEDSNELTSVKESEDHLAKSDFKKDALNSTEDTDALDLQTVPSAFCEPKKKKARKAKKIDSDISDVNESIKTKKAIKDMQELEGEHHQDENMEEVTGEVVDEQEPSGAGFTIMEEVKANKNQKIFRVLPNWLAKPSVISCDLSNNKMPVKEVKGLDKFLHEALRRNKINHLFPVQQQIIPWLLESQKQLFRPCDMCVSAPTGSGKTLAFVLPTIQALVRQTVRRLRCLVVLPVHDLAVQVFRVYTSFCVGTKLHVALISGQTSFYEEQQLLVRKGITGDYLSKADIVVCTPGRLVDHLQRTAGFSLKSLRYLIIDEADRIMDESHNDWLYHVEKAINTSMEPLVAQKLSRPWENFVQKLLFSATLSQDPEKLTRLGLFQPKLFTSVVSTEGVAGNTETSTHHFVGKYTTPAELTEHYVQCSPTLKPLIVYHLLKKFKYRPALCFSVSRASTHRLCLLLKAFGDIKVAECSSEISKVARDQLLKDFSSGKLDLMVCTDAVARGMDLGVVDCVISYDPPKFVKNYIHRVGRTARAGRSGTAITLLTDPELMSFTRLIETAEKKNVTKLEVDIEEVQVYEDKFRAALETLKTSVEEEKQVKISKSDKMRRKKRFIKPRTKNASKVASSVRRPGGPTKNKSHTTNKHKTVKQPNKA